MNLEILKEIIRRKPQFFLIASLGYLLVTAFIKWGLSAEIGTLLYILGGITGIYFLDLAEVFFHLNPSPFRSMVFVGAFVIVSLFITTSSNAMEASGLVLSLYLTLVLWQVGQWQIHGNLDSWYTQVAGKISLPVQRAILIGFVLIFVFQTFLFIR